MPRGLRAFLGVMSDERERRDALRATWFPNATALHWCVAAPDQSAWQLEEAVGTCIRFVLGHWPDGLRKGEGLANNTSLHAPESNNRGTY